MSHVDRRLLAFRSVVQQDDQQAQHARLRLHKLRMYGPDSEEMRRGESGFGAAATLLRRLHVPQTRRDGIQSEKAMTFHDWAKANGYDPKKRRYEGDTSAVISAMPGAHPNVNRVGARKVA